MTPDTLYRYLAEADTAEKKSVFAALRPHTSLEAQLQAYHNQGKPFAGQFCFVKDNFDVPGFPTLASSRFLEKVRPGPHSAGPLVQKLDALGLSIAGKTQMNEFAYGLDGANPHFGDCPHPFLPGHCSGGSSSGSAWVVAKALAPIAFGTDTGGSIRVPAAFCGLFGFRLPPDLWAQTGCFPLAPRFDSAGWFTRDFDTMATYTRALLDLPPPQPRKLRIASAIPGPSPFSTAIQSSFPDAQPLQNFNPEKLSQERVNAYNILQSLEALHIHREWIDSYADLYDPAVRDRILRGRSWSASDIQQAENKAQETRQQFTRWFEEWDVILYPVSLETAPTFPMTLPERTGLLANTVPASLAGNPVLTLPVSSPEGPLGLQCILPANSWKPILSRLLTTT